MVTRSDMEAIQAKIVANIASHGWAVQMVLPGRDTAVDPSFAYTIGLTETFRHPELLMIGFEPTMMQSLLNAAGEAIRQGEHLGDWSRSERVLKDYPVYCREVPAEHAGRWARGARARYQKSGYRLLQVFLPDPGGRFPWDADCAPQYRRGQGHLLDNLAKSA